MAPPLLLLFALFLAAVLVGTTVLVARHLKGRRTARADGAAKPTAHDARTRVADRYVPESPEHVRVRRPPAERPVATSPGYATLGDVWRKWDSACRAAGAEYFLAYSSLFLHGVKDDGEVPLDFFYVDVGMMADQVTKLRNSLMTGDDANDGEYRVLFPEGGDERGDESVEVVLRHEPTSMMVRAHAFYPEEALGVPRATPPPEAEDGDDKARQLATLDGRLYPRELLESLVEVDVCGVRAKAPSSSDKLYELQGEDAVPVTLDQSLHPGEPRFITLSAA
jgi:hypothetical protein